MRCVILLVNWNGWRDTVECLDSLFRMENQDFRVVVCDNGSQDDSLQKIRLWAEGGMSVQADAPLRPSAHVASPEQKPIPITTYNRSLAEAGGDAGEQARLVLVDIGENLGFAGGNNVGLRYILSGRDCEFVWLLNNDTVVEAKALTALVKRMSETPGAGICGSTLLEYSHPERIQARGGGYYCKWIGLPWHLGRLEKTTRDADVRNVERWMNYVVGASLFTSRRFVEDVGLLSEEYFLYFEEVDWAIRSRARYSLAYAPESIVYHKIGASIGTSSNPRLKSRVCEFYSVRNRLFFTRKYYPYALPTVYLALLLTLAGKCLLGQWERIGMILQLFFNFGKPVSPGGPVSDGPCVASPSRHS
jgi:GT2 family glycosyltransferase